jgi:hypothetical protein
MKNANNIEIKILLFSAQSRIRMKTNMEPLTDPDVIKLIKANSLIESAIKILSK